MYERSEEGGAEWRHREINETDGRTENIRNRPREKTTINVFIFTRHLYFTNKSISAWVGGKVFGEK